ncbi:cation:proton antiporter [Pelagimonas sp. KU-00592-HH]|uniref:cation:proton antiporter n=1 Tax=Pelagimonas sp. KU-00592-HH TaxID=3127651 RepID=UPI003107D669
MTSIVTIIVLLAFTAYSLASKAIGRTILTLPILFTMLGLALSTPLEQIGETAAVHEGKRVLAEITLILVLFADASHVRFKQLSTSWRIPARMLIVGMPLTIALGTIVALALNPASGVAMAMLTAAVLTPTDAALGQPVVNSSEVPEDLSQSINVESGLNDGLALPFVLFGAVLASATHAGDEQLVHLAFEALREIVLGPLAGIAVGWAIAKLLDWAQGADLTNESASGLVFLSSAFLAYAVSVSIGGNGFIAAFVAGMTFGNTFRHNIHFISEFMEGAGQLLTMASFLAFGAFLLPTGIEHMQVTTVVLALLFLSAVRVLPIWLSLSGSGLKLPEKLFLGWFGPRGLASILFTLIIIDEFDFPNEAELLACVSLTVGASILLHGFSAAPLARRIGK